MLLRQFVKIPVGIIAFVAASSAVEKYSKYNLSLFCYFSVICMSSSCMKSVRTFQNIVSLESEI